MVPRGVPWPWGVPWPSRGVPWPLYEEYAAELLYYHYLREIVIEIGIMLFHYGLGFADFSA